MTQKDLYVRIAGETGISPAKAEEVIKALGHITADVFKADKSEKVVLPGIGTIKLAVRAARTGKNPKTGETIEIASSVRPTLTNVKTQDLYKTIN